MHTKKLSINKYWAFAYESEDVLFRNHVHIFKAALYKSHIQSPQITKVIVQVRIQFGRKTTLEVVFLQRDTSNAELFMSQFRRQYLKRSYTLFATAA